MADNIRATPRNEFLGLLADAMYDGLEYMKDPRRTQQMQGLAGLLESTGIPKTTERMAYGEDLTNIGRANVPLLKPETAEAMMTVAPFLPKGMKMTEGMPVGMSIKNVAKDGLAIKKGYGTTSSGREKPIWNIVDTNRNDEVVETFDRKGDASYLLDKWRKNTPQNQVQQIDAPQQAALDLAQQRATLPVEQGGLGLPANNTAMDRARAMGFDTDVYHATNIDFTSINPSVKGKYGAGVYTATTPKYAEIYAQGENARTLPLMARGNLASDDERIAIADQMLEQYRTKESMDVPLWKQKTKEELANRGYTGVGIGQERLMFSPSDLRSRFAAFDPFRKDVATATAMGVAAPDLLAEEPTLEELQRRQSAGLLFP